MSDINRYNPQKFRGDASQTYCAAFYKHTNIRADGNAYAKCNASNAIMYFTSCPSVMSRWYMMGVVFSRFILCQLHESRQ